MATVVGPYTVLNKAKINPADGTVTVVATVVETGSNRLIIDNLPMNLVNTVKANIQALAPNSYDYIGS